MSERRRLGALAGFALLAGFVISCGGGDSRSQRQPLPAEARCHPSAEASDENVCGALLTLVASLSTEIVADEEPSCDSSSVPIERLELVFVADDSISTMELRDPARASVEALIEVLTAGDHFVAFWMNESAAWLNDPVPMLEVRRDAPVWPGTPPKPPSAPELEKRGDELTSQYADIVRQRAELGADRLNVSRYLERKQAWESDFDDFTIDVEEWLSTLQRAWRDGAELWRSGRDEHRAWCAAVDDTARAVDAWRARQAGAISHDPPGATSSPVAEAIARAVLLFDESEPATRVLVVNGDLETFYAVRDGVPSGGDLASGVLEGIHVFVAPFRPDLRSYRDAELAIDAFFETGGPESVEVVPSDDHPSEIAERVRALALR